MTNFARATAAVCGAFLLLEPARTLADPWYIRELMTVGANKDLSSDPSIAFDLDSERYISAFQELDQIGLHCALAVFYDGEEPFEVERFSDSGAFAIAELPVTFPFPGYSAVRVDSNGNSVASEVVPSATDPTKLDVIPRSDSFAVMGDRIRISLEGKVLFAEGAAPFGSYSSIRMSTSGTTSTTLIDNSGPFAELYPPSSNQSFSHIVFPAYLDDGTGGFWSLQNGVATPIVTSNDDYAAFGGITVNDRGTVAFRFVDHTGVESLARLVRHNKVEKVMSSAGPFLGMTDPSVNNRNEIVAHATSDDTSQGLYFIPFYDVTQIYMSNAPTGVESVSALPSPTPVTVIKSGDALSGSTVTEVSVGTQALTDRGEIIFRAKLADGREGIYFATPKRSALLNIATRLRVLTGENVLIAGFIVTGTDSKKVIIRGTGPSLGAFGVQGALADPVLELHQGSATLATNNNWKIKDSDGASQEAEIRATNLPPSNDNEAALVATLSPGAYTAILSGTNSGTGVGLVEVYDLDQVAKSQAVNISTRGFVDTGDNVMIGGLIAGPADAVGSRILIRALGPSLQSFGVAGALANPFLELHDASGATLATNDNWKVNAADGSSQQAEIEATTISPPTNDLESAIVASLPPGNYTAIVRGTGNSSGVSLVEFYNLK